MSFEVVMPKMGESIVEGTIIEWKKKWESIFLKMRPARNIHR